MSNYAMKSLLKGLRYISQIFVVSTEPDDKEPELQIGYPTDVVHVTHVGCGDALNAPGWMEEFQASDHSADGAEPKIDLSSTMTLGPPPRGDISSPRDASCQNSRSTKGNPSMQKQRRNRSVPDELTFQQQHSDSSLPKPTRRRGSTGVSMAESAGNDGSGSGRVGSRHGKLARNKEQEDNGMESSSSSSSSWAEPPPLIPKPPRSKRHGKGESWVG